MRPVKLRNSFCGVLPDHHFPIFFLRRCEGWKIFLNARWGKGGPGLEKGCCLAPSPWLGWTPLRKALDLEEPQGATLSMGKERGKSLGWGLDWILDNCTDIYIL